MNHPKKNKIQDPILPAGKQDDDDRNLIELELAEEISIEDRISMYWMENKRFIIGCVAALVLAIVATNGIRIYQEFSTEQLQADYAAAQSDATLAEFAQANSDHALGGLAALTFADQAFRDKEFSQALEFYAIASQALSGNILAGRAALGQAFSLYYNDQTELGLARLNSISADSNLPESARAEAIYHLAIEADMAGNNEVFENYAAQINAMALAGQWQQRLSYYQQQAR